MSIFDLLPCEGTGITADKMFFDKKIPMTRECALSIIRAEERWGKGVMRKELLAEARQVMKVEVGDSYDEVQRGDVE